MNDKPFYKQPPEIEEGNREYKWKIPLLNTLRLEKFVSQMKYRLYEGNGKAIYILGVLDDGKPIGTSQEELTVTIDQVLKVVKILNAKVEHINYYNGLVGQIATIKIALDIKHLPENVLF